MKSKQQKRTEAIERQMKYNSLTLHERYQLVVNRPGNSRREFTRVSNDSMPSVWMADFKNNTVTRLFQGTPLECKKYRDLLLISGKYDISKENLGIWSSLIGTRFDQYKLVEEN